MESQKTFLCPLKYIAQKKPHKVAIESGGLKITYKVLDHLADQVADRLSPFDHKRVGILAKDQKRLIILLFACLRKNITPIFLNIRWPKFQITKALETLNCSLYLHEGLELDTTDILQSTLEKLFELRNEIDPSDSIKEKASIILHTSSSTSFAKACSLNIKSLLISAKNISDATNLNYKSKTLLNLPLFHIAGIAAVLRSVIQGSTICLPFASLEKDLVQYQITHVSMVPTQVYRLLLSSKKTLKTIASSLECLLLGGGPINQSLLENAKEYGLPIYVTYGMTETCSAILIKRDPIIEDGKIYLGMPLSHMQMALSEESVILVKGASLFEGYLESRCQLPLESKGWFSTKDLAEFCLKKGFCILGRKDHQFISGGENIQPEQIERSLMALDDIIEAIVVPVKDIEFGQRPVAFIKAKKRLDNLAKTLEKKLPKYKIPTHFFDLNELDFGEIKRKRKDLITMAEEKISKKNSPK